MTKEGVTARSGPAAMLRHRFQTVGQLKQHLHPLDGRSFLFYRGAGHSLVVGARVLLDVSFTDTEQQALLRGHVLGRVDGALSGHWLEFPDTRLLKKADEGEIVSRKQRRVGCDVLIEVRKAGGPSLGRLVDLSLGGARFAGAGGLRVKDLVEVRLVSPGKDLPSELGRAEVVRSGDHDIGTRFLRDHPPTRMAITRLFAAVQDSWGKAPEVSHPPACCQGGLVIEPPLPRVKGRERPL
jgi:hypothetical protein